MERLFCDVWRYAPIAERKRLKLEGISARSCACAECVAVLMSSTDSAAQQHAIRVLSAGSCSTSAARYAWPLIEVPARTITLQDLQMPVATGMRGGTRVAA